MEPLFEHRLELAGYETRALELEGEGPPLILFHGYADSADTWRLVLDRLARRGRRAVALDMPGFGTADRLDPARGILEQLDAFATAALAELAPEGGALVCGNSLGGCVALRLAEHEDNRLAGIVPVAPAGLDMARWFAVIERDPLIRGLLASPLPIPRPLLQLTVAEVFKRLAFHRARAVDPKIARTFATHFADRATTAAMLATGRRLLPELRGSLDPTAISCPVLLVWGRRDVMVFQTGAERVLDAVPGARLAIIEDCGHCPQLEAPDRLEELLVEFTAATAGAA